MKRWQLTLLTVLAMFLIMTSMLACQGNDYTADIADLKAKVASIEIQIDDLKGMPGPAGPEGPKGDQGDPGPQGIRGYCVL